MMRTRTSGRMATGTRIAAAMALTTAILLSAGCSNEGETMTPSGDELTAQAEENYLRYRTTTNEIQSRIDQGPWSFDLGDYGMQPGNAGCGEGTYNFDLTRSTRVDPAAQEEMIADVDSYLVEAGLEPEQRVLGAGDVKTTELIVEKQGDFSLLMVTFIANGSVLVTASTTCWPGDADELGDLLFGDVDLADGYLPRTEAPTDELFFGITPGEPRFGPGAD